MAAKTLPGNEYTQDDFRNWVIKESVGNESGAHIIIISADQAYTQYDMVVSLPWCGIADKAADTGDSFSLYVSEGIQIDSSQIADGSAFTTQGQEVWYNPATKLYHNTEDEGLYLVGYVMIPTNSNGVFRFEKRRYVVEGEGT